MNVVVVVVVVIVFDTINTHPVCIVDSLSVHMHAYIRLNLACVYFSVTMTV